MISHNQSTDTNLFIPTIINKLLQTYASVTGSLQISVFLLNLKKFAILFASKRKLLNNFYTNTELKGRFVNTIHSFMTGEIRKIGENPLYDGKPVHDGID